MKKFCFAALCMLLAASISMAGQNPQKDNQKLRAGAAAFESENAGAEGAMAFEKFCQGDDTYRIYRNSPYSQRKAAVKVAEKICKARKVTYKQYADFAKEMGFKPKSLKKFKNARIE